MAKKKMGRPPTVHGQYPPNRPLGRIPQAEWDEIRAGAMKSGKPFSQWAKEVLLTAARKQK